MLASQFSRKVEHEEKVYGLKVCLGYNPREAKERGRSESGEVGEQGGEILNGVPLRLKHDCLPSCAGWSSERSSELRHFRPSVRACAVGDGAGEGKDKKNIYSLISIPQQSKFHLTGY